MARAAFTVIEPSDEAAEICSRGTNSGWMACQAGAVSALPAPSRKVMASSSAGVSTSAQASTASNSAITAE